MFSDNIWHIIPVNDLKPHIDKLTPEGEIVFEKGQMWKQMKCMCACNPTLEFTDNDAVIVIHHSFDGREGIEAVNEILGNKE